MIAMITSAASNKFSFFFIALPQLKFNGDGPTELRRTRQQLQRPCGTVAKRDSKPCLQTCGISFYAPCAISCFTSASSY
jgi:hypothetical protein